MTSTEAADQWACTEAVVDRVPDDALVVANLGIAGWVLMETDDRERNFYMRGAMGSTTPVGHGLALSADEEVVVLEGDGSLLMSLGCLSTIGAYPPDNLTVVVWDNRAFATTGGQPTATDTTDLAAAAEACGLAGYRTDSDDGFEAAFADALAHDGPSLVSCVVDHADASAPEGYDYGHSFLKHRFRSAVLGD